MRLRTTLPMTLALFCVGLGSQLGAAEPADTAKAGPHGSSAGVVPAVPAPSPVTFAPMLASVEPCVVSVYSSRVVGAAGLTPGSDEGDLLRRYFGPMLPDQGIRPGQQRQHGLGSGVIVRADGYILTNSHVVDDADDVQVALAEGSERLPAKVIGVDPQADLAVLKVTVPDGAHLPVLPLGDSDRARVGDLVFAIGNPFAVGQTVTMGIISATGRGGLSIEDYEDFIQTDASINPGNSGGALVTADGKLVGINTAILSPSGGNLGIGFAIPIGMAKEVMDAIITTGKVSRGFLGVSAQALTPDLASALKLDPAVSHGVLVADVVAHGPAAEAGIATGDVILRINGSVVPDPRHLRLMVGRLAPGAEVTLDLIHEGAERHAAVKLLDLADRKPHQAAAQGQPGAAHPTIGLRLTDLDSEARRQLAVPDGVDGALVSAVDRDSPAETAGIAPGEIITQVAGSRVTSAESTVQAIHAHTGIDLLLQVWGQGSKRFVVVHPRLANRDEH